MTTLSINIRLLRKKEKLTQEYLATQCGVSGAAVSQWESKTDPTKPDIDHMLVMSRLFGVTIEQLMRSETAGDFSKKSLELNSSATQKVFEAIDMNKSVEKVFRNSDPEKKSLVFCLFYTLCSDIEPKELTEDPRLMEAIGLMTR